MEARDAIDSENSGFDVSFQTRGREVLRIDDYAPAAQEDVAKAHSLQYVKGLEKVSVLFGSSVVIDHKITVISRFYCTRSWIRQLKRDSSM